MTPVVSVLFLLLYPSLVLGQLIHRPVILGDSVILPALKNCTEGEKATWDHRLDHGEQPVAVFDQGGFSAIGEYLNRTKPLTTGGNMSVILTRAIYTDKQGSFEFRCGGRFINEVQLETLIPFEQFESVGRNATLRFYFDTTAEAGELIRWEKDGKRVCEVNAASWMVRYGTGFEGRVSISRDRYREGNLSLTLMGVNEADEGLYRCYHGKDKGNPDAVKLIISPTPAKPSDQPAPATPQENTKEAMDTKPIVITAVVTFFITALLMALGWFLKARWCNGSNSGTSSGLQAVPMSDVNGGGETHPLRNVGTGTGTLMLRSPEHEEP